MATIQVLGPEEMIKRWEQALPDVVVETFNELLAKQFDGVSATVKDKDILAALRVKSVDTKDVTEQRWLMQTKQLYQERGWKVTHNTPDYDDNFDSYFRFAIK